MEARFLLPSKSDPSFLQELQREFGGYLPLELPQVSGEFYQQNKSMDVLSVSSGRSGFYFAGIDSGASKVYLPYFTCLDTESPFRALGMEVVKYRLDENFLPLDVEVEEGSILVWTNYYGNASRRDIETVASRHKSLLIDNCHAFFSPPLPSAYNVYSARKFFGVSDGGYLISNQLRVGNIPAGSSHDHVQHLAKQIDCGTNNAYPQHLKNEARLELDFAGMSKFTQRVLSSVDYAAVYSKRRSNFLLLHALLSEQNEFPINLASETHMYYPFKVPIQGLRERLLQKRIFSPYWWRHVLDEVPPKSVEARFAQETVLLPIDQRYSSDDMFEISRILRACL